MTPDTQCVKGLVVNYFSLQDCTPDTQCVKTISAWTVLWLTISTWIV